MIEQGLGLGLGLKPKLIPATSDCFGSVRLRLKEAEILYRFTV